MSYYIGIPLVFFVALSEAAVLPMFRVAGLQPNPTLVLLIAWLMVRGPGEAFVLIPVGGISLGLVDSAPLGTALLALAPLALLQEIRGAQLREGGLVLTALFTLGMTAVYSLVYLLVFTLGADNGDWISAFTRAIIPVAFLNVIFLLPVYSLLWLTSGDLRRAAYV